ncbi:hypothetical protein HDU92_003843 [Lobulomyces angularis]|nr:hypothetical protein HDU92_003843 [Lobulomyces angularis]
MQIAICANIFLRQGSCRLLFKSQNLTIAKIPYNEFEFYPSPSYRMNSTTLELRISCQNLFNPINPLNKISPQVILYIKSNQNQSWINLGKTETIKDSISPEFSKFFTIEYYFEEVQDLKFELINNDGHHNSESHAPIACIETTLANIVTNVGKTLKKKLKRGLFVIVAEEVILNQKEKCRFRFSARNLDKKDFFGKSDPYFTISKAKEDGSFTLVYRSDPIMKTLDPIWPRFDISLSELCAGDKKRNLRFQIFDWNKSGNHELIGSFNTNIEEILKKLKNNSIEFEIKNFDLMVKKKGYQNSGIFRIIQFDLIKIPSFLDYISGGMSLDFAVGIDFTASNGDILHPASLHFRNENSFNQYQQAILAIGRILEIYDSTKSFPCYGFGAKLGSLNAPTNHCFPLNGNEYFPEVNGCQGILEAYNFALNNYVILHGPTNFSPIIDAMADLVKRELLRFGNGSFYKVLLILTDGAVTDTDQTINSIIEASTLPFSIIIVGVGNKNDWNSLIHLTSVDGYLNNDDGFYKTAARDIVQFVPFIKNRANLAQVVLKEIPKQIVDYMVSHSIKPNPPQFNLSSDSLERNSNSLDRNSNSMGSYVQRLGSFSLTRSNSTHLLVHPNAYRMQEESVIRTDLDSPPEYTETATSTSVTNHSFSTLTQNRYPDIIDSNTVSPNLRPNYRSSTLFSTSGSSDSPNLHYIHSVTSNNINSSNFRSENSLGRSFTANSPPSFSSSPVLGFHLSEPFLEMSSNSLNERFQHLHINNVSGSNNYRSQTSPIPINSPPTNVNNGIHVLRGPRSPNFNKNHIHSNSNDNTSFVSRFLR